MAYVAPIPPGAADAYLHALSDSQVAIIRKHLRWDVPINATADDLYRSNALFTGDLSGERPRHGNGNMREAGYQLDFDGDGKRDLGVWVPPKAQGQLGQWTILLSTRGFSTTTGQFMSVMFGELGDTPVPADYTGDGKADIAVFQPGGGLARNVPTDTNAYWRWCPTPSPPESAPAMCPNPATPILYGIRQDVPQPGLDFDGNPSTPELAVYRHSSGRYFWRLVATSTSTPIIVGGQGAVPLPGHYDGDFKTDAAVYMPFEYSSSKPAFLLRKSTDAYASTTTREFDAQLIAKRSGTADDRAGAVPLSGLHWPLYICSPFCLPYPRRAFGVWYPGDNKWYVNWHPTANGTIQSCSYGWGAVDQPITNIDRNGDMITDFVQFRANSWDGVGTTFFKHSDVSGGCTGSTWSVTSILNSRTRTRAFAVADMTTDWKPEIVHLKADGSISWCTSESNYTTCYVRTIGDPGAVFL